VEVNLQPCMKMGLGQPLAGLKIMKGDDLSPSHEQNPNSQVYNAYPVYLSDTIKQLDQINQCGWSSSKLLLSDFKHTFQHSSHM
jgi:hypothetical protein